MQEEVIKDFYGRIIGRIRIKDNGDKDVFDFYGRKLGYYLKSNNTTYDFYGRIIARGDACSMLLK